MNPLLFCLLLIGWQDPVQKPPAIQPPVAENQKDAKANAHSVARYYLELAEQKNSSPTTLDQAIAQALVNHPDMRLAEAELRVAEAKLAQARIMVSQKVTEVFHQLQKERADVELANGNWERMTKLLKNSAISQEEYRVAQHQLASAKARLATTESAWKLMMGSPGNRRGSLSTANGFLLAFQDQKDPQDYASALSRYIHVLQNPVYEVYNAVPDKTDAGTKDILEQLKAKLSTRVKLE